MERPILNPPNPYVGTLRVFPGTLVKIGGRARPNATRFAINFQTGPSLNPRDDLAFHLSPCFSPPRVVRNSLRAGAWGLEEAWGNGSLFSPHQPFEIMILTEPDQFKIAINGAHFCEFRHRIPYQEITHLTIDGDVDIERITITSSSSAPSYQPTAPTPSNLPPYPTSNMPIGMPMPTPSAYPSLPAGQQFPSGPYPTPSSYPSSMPPVSGPMPTGASYMSGYPPSSGPAPAYPQPSGYPAMPGGAPNTAGYPQPGAYPSGPMPAAGSYQGPHQQPAHSSSSPFGSLPIGGKALGTLAGVLKEGVYRKFPLARHFL